MSSGSNNLPQIPRSRLLDAALGKQAGAWFQKLSTLERLEVIVQDSSGATVRVPIIFAKDNASIDLRVIARNVAAAAAAAATGGDFFGPAASTPNNFVVFSDSTGKRGRDSGLSLDDIVGGTANFTNIKRLAAQTIAHLTDTAVIFDTAVSNPVALWNSGVPTRITIPSGEGGIYGVSSQVTFYPNLTGNRYIWIRKNGSIYRSVQNRTSAGGPGPPIVPTYVQTVDFLQLEAGDYIEIQCHQTTGAPLDIYSSGPLGAPACELTVLKLDRLGLMTSGDGGDCNACTDRILVSSTGEVLTSTLGKVLISSEE